jgi:MtN3 and saliva related transmembrane protein
MNVEIVGIAAGVLSCTTFIPQVIKTYRSKSTKDVSLVMFIIASVSTSMWLAYGILINSFSLIFTNAIVLFLSLVMIYLKILFKNS